MKLVFYGDSLTSGENNNFVSYVDKLHDKGYNVLKIGVSGTTLGEYSLYPVEGYSLSLQLKGKEFESADYVFLEYGLNDAAAICVGEVTLLRAILELRKRVDFIRQTSPDTKIVFLSVGTKYHMIAFGATQERYLLEDYLKDVKELLPDVTTSNLADSYETICNYAEAYCDYVCPMFKNNQYLSTVLDKDCLHPNDKGYEMIAENISSFIIERRKYENTNS